MCPCPRQARAQAKESKYTAVASKLLWAQHKFTSSVWCYSSKQAAQRFEFEIHFWKKRIYSNKDGWHHLHFNWIPAGRFLCTAVFLTRSKSMSKQFAPCFRSILAHDSMNTESWRENKVWEEDRPVRRCNTYSWNSQAVLLNKLSIYKHYFLNNQSILCTNQNSILRVFFTKCPSPDIATLSEINSKPCISGQVNIFIQVRSSKIAQSRTISSRALLTTAAVQSTQNYDKDKMSVRFLFRFLTWIPTCSMVMPSWIELNWIYSRAKHRWYLYDTGHI